MMCTISEMSKQAVYGGPRIRLVFFVRFYPVTSVGFLCFVLGGRNHSVHFLFETVYGIFFTM